MRVRVWGCVCVCVCFFLHLCASMCRKIHSYQILHRGTTQTAGAGEEQHLTFTTMEPRHHANTREKHQLPHNLVIIE